MNYFFTLCVAAHLLIGFTRIKAGLFWYGLAMIVTGVTAATLELDTIDAKSIFVSVLYIALFVKSHKVMADHDLWARVFR